LKFTAIILDKVLVGEEEYVRVTQGLVHVPVAHQLLISKSLISLLFLMLGDNLGRYKVYRPCYCLGYDKLEMSDFFL